MSLIVQDPSLVVLVGPTGAGKSTFAARHFRPTEVLSSDACRAWVADDPSDQAATKDAFEVLHAVLAKRLAAGRLSVVDATNVQEEARRPLVALARQFHLLSVAIVFDLPERVCAERNRARPDRTFGPHVIRQQARDLRRSLRRLGREGFRYVHVLDSAEGVDAAIVERTPLWVDRRGDAGPFDIVGDVHGCRDELVALLARLGYATEPPYGHPQGRRAVFLGDLVDRGPDSSGVLRLVMGMVESGCALCVPGNHDARLLRKLSGRDVRLTHGLAETLAQLDREPPEWRERVRAFLDGLVSHYVLDGGALVVAHAGLKADMQGRSSGRVREFALYGDTTGETDAYGLPVRLDWAGGYTGRAHVVYGHTPVVEAEWVSRTIDIDTGCVFGGRLSALRWPEREVVSVPAVRTYAEAARPLPGAAEPPSTAPPDDLLDIEDVLGKRIVSTRLKGSVIVREENALAALEVMSRFSVDPRWLVYLPPTMSPCETSARTDLLEHPAEAFSHYRHEGVPRVVCQEKHMGSRAVAVACRDEAAVRRRFGVTGGVTGTIYTRTGRPFFGDRATENALLSRIRVAMEASGLWAELDTDWVVLDGELMPWSGKAEGLLRTQYAPTGAAARAALPEAVRLLDSTSGAEELATRYRARAECADRYVAAYGRYCRRVSSPSDWRYAPFQVLATERGVPFDRDHAWHMELLRRLAEADGEALVATPCLEVDITDPESEARATAWWEERTSLGGEGMVVKPLGPITRGKRGLVQPALKVRGREYLRIIYGPEYTLPEHIERLRARALGAKRALALREFALGVESLERFVRREPLRRVHECVLGVLAFESEPVDPRL